MLEQPDPRFGLLPLIKATSVERRSARLCRTLIGLRTDLELEMNLSELRYLPADVQGRDN